MKIHIPEFRAMAKCNQHLDHGPIDIDLGPDVVRVVRCRDCKHEFGGSCIICGFQPREPEDFCSYGERRDGDTDGS